jgi:hypothetical protein
MYTFNGVSRLAIVDIGRFGFTGAANVMSRLLTLCHGHVVVNQDFDSIDSLHAPTSVARQHNVYCLGSLLGCRWSAGVAYMIVAI